MVAGRTTEPRVVAGVGTTSASAAITGPAGSFNLTDAGRRISGTGIPAGATLLSVASATAATLSANATATGTVAATIGVAGGSGPESYGFTGWSPESETEANTYKLASVNAGQVAPDRITNTTTGVSQRTRS